MNKEFKEIIDDYLSTIVTSQQEFYKSANKFYKLYYGVCPTCNNKDKCNSTNGFAGMARLGYSCEDMVNLQSEYKDNNAKFMTAVVSLRQFVNKYYDEEYLKNSNPDLYKIIHDVIHVELNPYNKEKADEPAVTGCIK